jgi:hypothetical protein
VIGVDVKSKLQAIKEGAVYIESGSLLHEAYYGRNPQLVKCEKLLDAAIQSKDGSKEVKQVEQIMQKMFNFKRLVISTVPLSLGLTIPVTNYKFKYIFDRIEMVKTSSGIAFADKDKVEAIMFIDLTLMYGAKITGEEALAIILHEIGHSMRMILPSAQITNALGAIAFTSAILPAIVYNFFGSELIDIGAKVDSWYNKFRDFIGRDSREVRAAGKEARIVINKFAGTISSFIKLVNFFKTHSTIVMQKWGLKWKAKDVFAELTGIGNLFGGATGAFIIGVRLAGLTYGLSKFKDEQLSDYIATAYGYGPQITSGLGKFDVYANKITLNNPFFRLINLPFNIVNTILDPHPQNVSRFKLIIENLEDELKKGVNQEAFDEIKQDLDAAKAELEKYDAAIKKRKLKNFDIIIFRKIMGKIIDGHDDVKALFFGLNPNDLKRLDDLEPLAIQTKEPQTITECEQLIQEMAHLSPAERKSAVELIMEN